MARPRGHAPNPVGDAAEPRPRLEEVVPERRRLSMVPARRLNVVLHAVAVVPAILGTIGRAVQAPAPGGLEPQVPDAPVLEGPVTAFTRNTGAPSALMAVPAVLLPAPLMRRRKAAAAPEG